MSGNSHAADVFKNKSVPEGFQRVPQDAWLDQRVLGGRDLKEQTLAFGNLGASLSMLWLPAERDEDRSDDDDDDDDPRWRR